MGSQEDEVVESSSDTDRRGGSSRSDGEDGEEDGGSGGESGSGGISRVDAPPPAERRDTLTLVSGLEVGGLGVDVHADAAAYKDRSKLTPASKNDEVAVDRQPAAALDRYEIARRWPEDESERMWKASLYTRKRGLRGSVHADAVDLRNSATVGPSSLDGMKSPSAAVADHSTTSATTERRDAASTGQATVAVSSPVDTGAGTPPSASRPGMLPTEVLASMLLSEHEFVGGNTSAADVLERARQWEQRRQQQQQQHDRRQQGRQRHATKTLPFPDLPYGFTDLGRRVNVGESQRPLEPSGDLVEMAAGREFC